MTRKKSERFCLGYISPISNAKRSILDTYHDIKAEFLQLYLNEFCYKFNRRYFGFRAL